ncbi:septal ring lytic transglycosylase RlpA family protein [Hyphomicrobium sp.]|uniref:septal ring lytic transglycosylase RlpA family protein n=1 Tax=Hyphomicrobium sp. TaxID=82 RepID=UPI002BA58ABF|nr:septal ring lytic transglycosylase RlpA family protein [Hyphomicrobium sp.]HVZ04640.1 septal ring lytic transglycosylase RlpA family protein [Hyphomicrobium sp.]
MRSFIAVAAFGVAAMTASAVPADAAWRCHGAAYVCGSSSHKAVKSRVSYRASHSKHAYAKKRYAHRAVRHSRYAYRTSRRHYAQAPARRHHATRVAARGGAYSGMASYYWQGQMTASGARFNPGALTAAHRTLPFGTRVRVTNRRNGRSVVVIINDRGPFVGGRVIDLSRAAAQAISMTGAGVAPVSLEVLGRS